jgi:hypothetical protein
MKIPGRWALKILKADNKQKVGIERKRWNAAFSLLYAPNTPQKIWAKLMLKP